MDEIERLINQPNLSFRLYSITIINSIKNWILDDKKNKQEELDYKVIEKDKI